MQITEDRNAFKTSNFREFGVQLNDFDFHGFLFFQSVLSNFYPEVGGRYFREGKILYQKIKCNFSSKITLFFLSAEGQKLYLPAEGILTSNRGLLELSN